MPHVLLLALGGCCVTPEPPIRPFPLDAGRFPVPDAPLRDAGPFIFTDAPPRDAGAPEICSMEIPGGAACDDEPCVSPVRRIVCPGGMQHLSVAAVSDGTTWISASYPPRLLHRFEEELFEEPLALDGEGDARVLFAPHDGAIWTLLSDTSLAARHVGLDERLPIAEGSAYFVVLGAAIDATGTLHAAWIDDGPGLHAGTLGLDDLSLAVREVSPTYFADSALAVGPDGAPHVAFWRHRPRSEGGRDLVVVDGDGTEHAIGYTTESNDDGTNVSIAASETALLASVDFEDGIHLYVPDDASSTTGYRDAIVPGSEPLAVTGCPDVPPPGPGGACSLEPCSEAGTGTLRHAQEIVRLADGRFALLWLERTEARDVSFAERCGGPGCICERVVTSETSSTDLVLGIIDEATGMPARTLVTPLGDVRSVDLHVSVIDGRMVVAMQDDDLSAVLVEIDLFLLGP